MGADFKWLERRENCEFHTQLGTRETSKLFLRFFNFFLLPLFLKNFLFRHLYFVCLLFKMNLSAGSLMESRFHSSFNNQTIEEEESFVFVCFF